MSEIKTNLRTATTDDQGAIELGGNRAFWGVFTMGLLVGSQDPSSKQYPTDAEGLRRMQDSLAGMTFECLSGLSGIGALMGAAKLQNLIEDDLENIGTLIRNLSLLAIEAQNHIDTIRATIDWQREDAE